jgi:hypothetical protein
MLYTHKKTGNRYHLLETVRLKFAGMWVEAVLYQDYKTGEKFVRTIGDWNEVFGDAIYVPGRQ